MDSTMQDGNLQISDILEYGRRVNYDSQVITFDGENFTRASFEAIGDRASQLAHALKELGVEAFDRVATFCFNHQHHLEAYLAAPSMGAVLHTLNIRLFPDQLSYVIKDAQDKIIIFDPEVFPLLVKVGDALGAVKHLISTKPFQSGEFNNIIYYEELIEGKPKEYLWPVVDEKKAAAMCYTSGTTGDPKGVVYSHRSTYLHTLAVMASMTLGISPEDRSLVIVPMFHANAWGTPYACFLAGADMIMPGRFLQAAPLARMFNELKPTISAGVPTIWNELLNYSKENPVDMSSVRVLVGGGSALPKSLIKAYREQFNVKLIQGWGMTETSPLCALSRPPRGVKTIDEEIDWYAKTGRVVPGVKIRIVDDNGNVLENDGTAIGEFEVSGPWITGSYFNRDETDRFHDGWLKTGDVGALDSHGNMQISDRSKDVIKSGGEWISSVDLENNLMAHPSVLEAAVIGIVDEKWGERPLACVVFKPGAQVDFAKLKEFLVDKVAKFQIPDHFARLDEIPKTSVGKFDKKLLRAKYESGELDAVKVSLFLRD